MTAGLLIGAVLGLAGLAGCASSAAGSGTPTTVRLDERANGQQVRVSSGQRIEVTLHSTYWTFDPLPAGGALAATGAPVVVASPPSAEGCVPGEGCGTVTLGLRAVGSGTAALSASRQSCGEARRCTAGEGRYQVVVVVDGPVAGAGSPPPSTTRGTPPRTAQPPSGAVVATEADNGRTVVVAVGQRLVVELHSTYWSLDRPAPASVLWPDGPVGVRASPPGVGCVPGGGCGTVSQAFLAVGPGTATIIAGRTSCGEAMGCTGDQGRYALTVIVKPR